MQVVSECGIHIFMNKDKSSKLMPLFGIIVLVFPVILYFFSDNSSCLVGDLTYLINGFVYSVYFKSIYLIFLLFVFVISLISKLRTKDLERKRIFYNFMKLAIIGSILYLASINIISKSSSECGISGSDQEPGVPYSDVANY